MFKTELHTLREAATQPTLMDKIVAEASSKFSGHPSQASITWIKARYARLSESEYQDSYEDNIEEFRSGQKVRLKEPYAGGAEGEVFTLSQVDYDRKRAWIGDDSNRGWYVRFYQIEPVADEAVDEGWFDGNKNKGPRYNEIAVIRLRIDDSVIDEVILSIRRVLGPDVNRLFRVPAADRYNETTCYIDNRDHHWPPVEGSGIVHPLIRAIWEDTGLDWSIFSFTVEISNEYIDEPYEPGDLADPEADQDYPDNESNIAAEDVTVTEGWFETGVGGNHPATSIYLAGTTGIDEIMAALCNVLPKPEQTIVSFGPLHKPVKINGAKYNYVINIDNESNRFPVSKVTDILNTYTWDLMRLLRNQNFVQITPATLNKDEVERHRENNPVLPKTRLIMIEVPIRFKNRIHTILSDLYGSDITFQRDTSSGDKHKCYIRYAPGITFETLHSDLSGYDWIHLGTAADFVAIDTNESDRNSNHQRIAEADDDNLSKVAHLTTKLVQSNVPDLDPYAQIISMTQKLAGGSIPQAQKLIDRAIRTHLGYKNYHDYFDSYKNDGELTEADKTPAEGRVRRALARTALRVAHKGRDTFTATLSAPDRNATDKTVKNLTHTLANNKMQIEVLNTSSAWKPFEGVTHDITFRLKTELDKNKDTGVQETMARVTEGWNGTPGWHHLEADHEVTKPLTKSNRDELLKNHHSPSHAGYLGKLDDMGEITHHVSNGKVVPGKPHLSEARLKDKPRYAPGTHVEVVAGTHKGKKGKVVPSLKGAYHSPYKGADISHRVSIDGKRYELSSSVLKPVSEAAPESKVGKIVSDFDKWQRKGFSPEQDEIDRQRRIEKKLAKKNGKKVEENADSPTEFRICVVVSEPDATMITKRKLQVQKFLRVKAGNHEIALIKARNFYKNQGYKVHDAWDATGA